MKPKPRFLLLAAIASIGLIGSFAYRMFRHDIRSLTEFAASYEQFDKRMSDFSDHATEADDEAADQALGDLAVRASMRLSSLIKNDGAMMRVARELSSAATKELTTLREYKRAALERNDDSAALLNRQFEDARSARKAAYAHFERLLTAPRNSE